MRPYPNADRALRQVHRHHAGTATLVVTPTMAGVLRGFQNMADQLARAHPPLGIARWLDNAHDSVRRATAPTLVHSGPVTMNVMPVGTDRAYEAGRSDGFASGLRAGAHPPLEGPMRA